MRNKAVLNHSDVVKSVCSEGQAEQLVYKRSEKMLIKEVVYNEYTDEMINKDKQVISGLLKKCFITGSRAKVAHLVRLTVSNEDLRYVNKNPLQESYTKYLKRNGHKFDDEDYIIQQDNVTPEEAMSLSRLHQHFMQTDKRAGSYYGVDTPLMLEHPTNKKKIDIFVVPFVENTDRQGVDKRYISLHNLVEACARMNRQKDWEFIKLISELQTCTEYDFHSEEWVTTSRIIKKIII